MRQEMLRTLKRWDSRKRGIAIMLFLTLLISLPAVFAYAALNEAPQVVSFTPTEGGTSSTGNVTITAAIADTDENINETSRAVYVDDIAVPSGWQFQGYEETDSCSLETYYVVSSYKAGTLTTAPVKLKDGQDHVAKIIISDAAGNVLTKEWKFNVASPPVFGEFTPANGSTSGLVAGISAKVTDEFGAVDGSSVTMAINGTQVPAIWQEATSTVVYDGQLSAGSYAVEVKGTDAIGTPGSSNWNFTLASNAPSISGTSTVTNGVLTCSGRVTDTVDLIGSVDLRLDGQPLPAGFSFPTKYDVWLEETVVTSTKSGSFYWSGPVPDGTHTLTLTVKNRLGNTATKTWTLDVGAPPVISEIAPTNYINTATPVISAKVADANTGIDTARITMTLDGEIVNAFYDEAGQKVSFTPVTPLTNETYHTVGLTVYDKNTAIPALSTTKTWKFYYTTYPDMKDSNFEACNACHPTFHGWNYGGNHTSNYQSKCRMCHSIITVDDGCYQCHGDPNNPEAYVPYQGHGSTTNIKYGLRNPDPNYAVRVTSNRELYDCTICHQPGSGFVGRGQINHDIPELHKGAVTSCTNCHAQSLTHEHAREGRVTHDSAGNEQPITCNTCHMSADPKVKNAILNKDKSCNACHTSADHDSLHASPLDPNCQTCHKGAVSSVHTSKMDANNNPLYTCAICHSNERKDVQRAVNNNDMNCAACHKESQTHRVIFADQVPKDIPLRMPVKEGQPEVYFQWTAPIEASIFAGDAGTPDQFGNGLVVLSNRNNTLSGSQIWTFFSTQLANNGWQVTTQPDTSAKSFTAELTKGGRGVYIRCYNTEYSNGTGNEIGYRVEVWYK